ncbi:EutG family ethanolamine utilization protein [Buttiauxella ferragutiae ATCC 51602]|jgi:alcohol dehydrogenase|uniref:EutG family ethanolamine utilization protein n=1 Tax=Buttiauxella ferragutiae ATCC 51602 TaxID=1354252 RepID=A0ABX2W496_9ENTR|nr:MULTISPECIES: iron-containing alcohol dehydrogenase [Buttiauxella]AYN30063.1 iron-containing alcohol dehydrogenase [Buttiauxella sp. 3AFRM03]MCE0827048.1 iron-containing alcohol dehydrogenase [Buttiauxella ferragutiae]OAT25493.1 EutG family ethanolamine utilization protein [Buttiauxella ferragutiae ATCC 51602]TDN48271.1 acetaldehyde reductase EutG [Buttiauxella sp. JUb87]UNK59614.1 iron-containing alcohol dehydrogenase [Buttiauxella ferragutiae]
MRSEEMQSALYQALDMMNARNVREFSVPPATFMGPGAVARCGEALRERGINRPLLMVDGMLHGAGMTEVLERNLRHSGIDYEVWPCPPGEPVDRDIGAAVEQIARCQCDGIIALGGGSVLDAAKVVAVIATNPDLALDNLVAGTRLNRRLPFIAIPTTSGTGSEATNVAVIIAAQTHRKQVLVHAMLIPDLAIIDACLTLGVPAHITAATGIDALTHAIEAYVASNGTPLTRGLAYRAISSIGQALPLAVGQGHDLAAREAMMLASYMAGMAFSNAGLGLCHASAHQIGAAYGIPHGKANAIMLPAVMKFNQLVCKSTYGEIGHALTGKSCAASETIACVEHLINELGLGCGLRAAGGCETDFANFARAALSDICITTNPRTVTEAQIIELYQDA